MTSTRTAEDPLARTREIAETVLFPATLAVDGAERVPAGHLDLLAREGFYGVAAPPEFGGPDVDFNTACTVLETLAAGCLCTTFVWMQHHGVVLRLAYGDNADLRTEWLPRLVTGAVRAGVALAGTRPGPPELVASRTRTGYVLNGQSPWVTGWGMVDVLAVAARDGDKIVWILLDATESESLTVDPLRMVAVSASNTVTAHFTEHAVPAHRVIGVQDYASWMVADGSGLRMNGSLSLGLAARCLTLLGPSPLDDELRACRAALDAGTAETLPEARAAASELAQRAANTLVAHAGSRAILLAEHPQKLAREALFLLVFASRPAIKESLLPRLAAPPLGH
jgi:alkylation response protein AidB-like acyl-CoA dehydrogenase